MLRRSITIGFVAVGLFGQGCVGADGMYGTDGEPLVGSYVPEAPINGLTDPHTATGSDPCDGMDNDGDDLVDEDCYCVANELQSCHPMPGAAGLGVCAWGTQLCHDIARGEFRFGHWGECVGYVLPSLEVCGNDTDEDCNGIAESCDGTDSGIDNPGGQDPNG